jgi:hypothetical protein
MNAKGLCSIKQKAGNVTVQGEVFYRSDLGSSKGKNLIVDRRNITEQSGGKNTVLQNY